MIEMNTYWNTMSIRLLTKQSDQKKQRIICGGGRFHHEDHSKLIVGADDFDTTDFKLGFETQNTT